MEQSPIDKLINDISKLPGLGRRSAQRIALFLLKNKDKNLSPLIESLNLSYNKIIECSESVSYTHLTLPTILRV